jgi:hypothetical protein
MGSTGGMPVICRNAVKILKEIYKENNTLDI